MFFADRTSFSKAKNQLAQFVVGFFPRDGRQ